MKFLDATTAVSMHSPFSSELQFSWFSLTCARSTRLTRCSSRLLL